MADDTASETLFQRARRAREDIAIVHNEIILRLAETRRIIAAVPWEAAPAPEPPASSIVMEASDDVTDQTMALEVVRMMIALMAGFPLEWQLKIIKVLTARTTLAGALQAQQPMVTPSA
jgi:hypothetical protein